ncbi:MAG: DUF1847 domain-containing protein [Thermoguttaceae bacterium]
MNHPLNVSNTAGLENYVGEKGSYQAMCNPILQAKVLNAQGTELNVLVGLCVGRDLLFIKYSEASVTTLVTKDRVLAQNPVAALYETHSYGGCEHGADESVQP